jgi:hypothetical protein
MKMKRTITPILITLMLSALYVVSAFGATSLDSTAVISGPEGELYVGDPILLTLSIHHSEDLQVIFPALDEQWGSFRVVSQTLEETLNHGDGFETSIQLIDVRAFQSGVFDTPPLLVKLSDTEGNLSEVSTAPISITIASVLVEGDSTLRDIKPQAALPYTNFLPWGALGGILLVAFLGVSFFYRRQRRNGHGGTIDNRLPHEVALDELDRIEKLDLPKTNAFKKHYTLISGCVRTYIENRYQVGTAERTTGEIFEDLKTADISPENIRNLVSILAECDLVKFSKFQPDAISANLIIVESREIISETTPVELDENFEDLGDKGVSQ